MCVRGGGGMCVRSGGEEGACVKYLPNGGNGAVGINGQEVGE